MDRRTVLAAATLFATGGIAGCLGGGGGGTAGEGTPEETAVEDADAVVELSNAAFVPVEATVPAGGTVRWVNRDSVGHDVTAATFSDGAADWDVSLSLDAGASTTHTFEREGVYEYYCTIHGRSTMCGVVLVGGVAYDGSLPCRSDGGGGYGGGDY